MFQDAFDPGEEGVFLLCADYEGGEHVAGFYAKLMVGSSWCFESRRACKAAE